MTGLVTGGQLEEWKGVSRDPPQLSVLLRTCTSYVTSLVSSHCARVMSLALSHQPPVQRLYGSPRAGRAHARAGRAHARAQGA